MLREKVIAKSYDKNAVRRELEDVLNSDQFKNSPRLSKFLNFVVNQTLAGKQSRLKAYQIAIDAFARDVSFDTQDPYVRNVAKDVRKALSAHYEPNPPPTSGIRISVPKGGYAPLFTSTESSAVVQPSVSQPAEVVANNPINDGNYKPTIAVIPLRALHCDESQKHIGEIFADDLINKISCQNNFNVISRLSTTSFADTQLDLLRIKDQLKANYVVSGTFSISPSSKTVKITIELADTTSGFVVHAEQIHLTIENLLNVDDNFINAIIENISGSITKTEIERVLSRNPLNLENYSLLISAISLLHRIAKSDFNKSKELLDILAKRNTRSPLPYAWTAKWYVLSHVQGMAGDAGTLKTTASDCAKKALDLDSKCSLALTIDGLVHTNILRDFDIAENRYNAALTHNPNDSLARLLRGTMYAFQGNGDNAMADVTMALKLSPLDPMSYYYLSLASTAALAAEKYKVALTFAQDSLKLNPYHASSLRAAAIANVNLDKHQEANENIEHLLQLDPNFSVNRFLAESPSAEFETGKHWAKSLTIAGAPER